MPANTVLPGVDGVDGLSHSLVALMGSSPELIHSSPEHGLNGLLPGVNGVLTRGVDDLLARGVDDLVLPGVNGDDQLPGIPHQELPRPRHLLQHSKCRHYSLTKERAATPRP